MKSKQKDNSRHKTRYRHDQEYRQNQLAGIKKREKENRRYRTYKELTNVRKKIATKRDVLERAITFLEKIESEMRHLVKRRDKLAAKWKQIRVQIKQQKLNSPKEIQK